MPLNYSELPARLNIQLHVETTPDFLYTTRWLQRLLQRLFLRSVMGMYGRTLRVKVVCRSRIYCRPAGTDGSHQNRHYHARERLLQSSTEWVVYNTLDVAMMSAPRALMQPALTS